MITVNKINELKNLFIDLYGESSEDIRFFTSPGRVNLIGEHVDYCGGLVFPAALTLSCVAAVRLNKSNTVNLRADDLDGLYSFNLADTQSGKNLKWGNYQAGVIHWLKDAGYEIQGMDFLFTGDIPFGSGLSSSAAIELTTAIAAVNLSANFKQKGYDLINLALVGQKAEHTFSGVNCGIMDQFASAMGKENHAILLNCATLEYKHVPLNLGEYTLILANTCKKHALGASAYNKRREEVAEGLTIMNDILKTEKQNLCDFTEDDYIKAEPFFPDDKVRDRVNHVIFENQRVKKAVEVLENGDLFAFGDILKAGHASLRDLYEVTGFELDTMFDIACKAEGCIGSRMTGGGFGGCTVNIVKKSAAENFVKTVGNAYKEKTQITPEFYVCNIGDGAREIKL
ncbi:MAG: galactokinase [Ruminococcaceae bacterium]|nr:galactokinase [Oscillospiraceae bacterium]